jgi:hypothetical protein
MTQEVFIDEQGNVILNRETFEPKPNEKFGNPYRENGELHVSFTFEGGHDYPMFYSSIEELSAIKQWYWES